jgi:hypothetical protein
VASWALAGIGVAGVAGASALAYADTVKPAPVEAPADEPVAGDPGPSPVVYAPPVPEVVPPTDTPLPPAPEPAPTYTQEPVTQAPVETTTPRYTPAPQYTPKTAVQPAPVQQTQAPASQPAFPIRTSHAPSVGSSSPNFTPRVTRSRGS